MRTVPQHVFVEPERHLVRMEWKDPRTVEILTHEQLKARKQTRKRSGGKGLHAGHEDPVTLAKARERGGKRSKKGAA